MKHFFLWLLVFSLLLSPEIQAHSGHDSSSPEETRAKAPEGKAPKDLKDINLQGLATNVTGNQPGQVSMQLTFKKGLLKAKGAYDSVGLFGRFELPGKFLPSCKGETSLCMQFEGDLLLGDDGSGFPSGTRAHYVMSLAMTPEGVKGTYRINGLESYFNYDQFGILELQKTEKADPALKKMKIQ